MVELPLECDIISAVRWRQSASVADGERVSENKSPSNPTRADDTGRVDLAAAEREIPVELGVFPSESTTPKRSRIAVRPAVLMLLVGGTLGLAGGYAVGVRERAESPIATTDTDAPPTPATVPVPPEPAPPEPAAAGTPTPTPTPNAEPSPAPPAAAQPPPEEPARPGLAVESRPPGARVFFDNKMIGITPLHLPDVPAGRHTVRLELRGYRPWSEDVLIVENQPHRVQETLVRRR